MQQDIIDHAIADHDRQTDAMSMALGEAWPMLERSIRATRAARPDASDGDVLQDAQTDEVLEHIAAVAARHGVDPSEITEALLDPGPEREAALHARSDDQEPEVAHVRGMA